MSGARGLVAALAVVVGLGACGGGGGGPTARAPVRGGTLVVAIWQEPNTLYPYYATQTVSNLVTEIALEGLVQVTPEGSYKAVLAKDVPTSGNGGLKLSPDGKGMDVTHHLRPGLKWADGQPVTSDDVRFTWQAIMKDPRVTTRGGDDHSTGRGTPHPLTPVRPHRSLYPPYPRPLSS